MKLYGGSTTSISFQHFTSVFLAIKIKFIAKRKKKSCSEEKSNGMYRNDQMLRFKFKLFCICNYLKTLVKRHPQQMSSFYPVFIQTSIHHPTVLK